MKRPVTPDLVVHTIPIYQDWTIEGMWSLNEGRDEPYDPKPDGEPMGWTNVLEYKGKVYKFADNGDCQCNIGETGKICEHWKMMRFKR